MSNTNNIIRGKDYINLAKVLEKSGANLEEAKIIALEIVKDPKIVRDIKNKRSVNEVIWTLTQVGMKAMGLGAIR
jgi:hypothetical protein